LALNLANRRRPYGVRDTPARPPAGRHARQLLRPVFSVANER